MKESNFLSDLIRKEEKELAELESKISAAQREVDDQKLAVQTYQSVLALAKHLGSSSEMILDTVKQGDNLASSTSAGLHHSASSTSPPSPFFQEALPAWNDLITNQVELLRVAKSMNQGVIQRTREAEKELGLRQSLLYFLNEHLASLLDLKQKAVGRILKMKSAISPKRRIPDEIWLQILTERIEEDEEPYTYMDLDGPPPFAALRLTWVCRQWRTIIIERRALWRYIAIPAVDYPTRPQWERIQCFKDRLGIIAPHVYAIKKTQFRAYSGHNLAHLLQEFVSFGRLKLYVDFDPVLYRLFGPLQAEIQELILIRKCQKENDHDIYFDILAFLKNTRSLRCTKIEHSPAATNTATTTDLLNTTIPHLESIHLSHYRSCPRNIVSFLRAATSLTTLTITLLQPTRYLPFVTSQVTLSNLAFISADIITLESIFSPFIHLPKLAGLSVVLVPYDDDNEMNHWWNTFISVGQRRDAISSFGISANHPQLTKSKIAKGSKYLLNSLPNIKNHHRHVKVFIPQNNRITTEAPLLMDLRKMRVIGSH
jgi:hypothetical protein